MKTITWMMRTLALTSFLVMGCGMDEGADDAVTIFGAKIEQRSVDGGLIVSGSTSDGPVELQAQSVLSAQASELSVAYPPGPNGPVCLNCTCLPVPCTRFSDPTPHCYECYCSYGKCVSIAKQ